MSMTDVARRTIQSQYANSDEIISLITSLSERIEGDSFSQQFLSDAMSIATAGTWGLDVWGRIVGISRKTPLAAEDGEYFGFEDGFYPFNNRPMFSGSTGGGAFEFPNSTYRELILIKAAVNIIDATALNINAFLKMLFPDERSYYLITGHMQASYVFEFEFTPAQRQIVFNTDVLPRPCGVGVSIIENPPA